MPSPEILSVHFPGLEILELIGRGGMGIVYKARQIELDRLVALKILPAVPGGDPAFAERFTREARALARLSHPHIVAIHDFGQKDGLYFFLMEYVDGANLRQSLSAGQMSSEAALAIVPQICDALQYAHDQGIVHRDIKPENILLEKGGRVKIADFGLAKILTSPADVTLTEAGEFMGTTHYMAPEQVERPESVDRRADIFSLGVVFYQMLTGQLPIGRFAPPSRSVKVDVRIDEVVLRALENKPEMRFSQAGEVKTEIETIRTTPAPAPPSAPTPARPAAVKSSGRLRVLIVTLAALLGAAAAFQLVNLPRKYEAATTIQLRGLSPELSPEALERILPLISSREVLGPVAATLLPGHNPEEAFLELRRSISVRQIRNENLLQISVFANTPLAAADRANAIARQFETVRNTAAKEQNAKEIAGLEKEVEEQGRIVLAARFAVIQASREAGWEGTDPDQFDLEAAFQESRRKSTSELAALKKYVETAEQLSDWEFLQDPAIAPYLGFPGPPEFSNFLEVKTEEAQLLASGMASNHPTIKALKARKQVLEKEVADTAAACRKQLKRVLVIKEETFAAEERLGGQPLQNYRAVRDTYLKQKRLLKSAEEKLAIEQRERSQRDAPVVIWERAEPRADPPGRVPLFLAAGSTAGLLAGLFLSFLPHPRRPVQGRSASTGRQD